MADIKRPSYFTSQFLVARDLSDEQAYHVDSRRRHRRTMHASGVVAGLGVGFVIGRQVRVEPGSAVDRDGREIVLVDAQTYALVAGGVGDDVYLTIAYNELFDPSDRYTQTGLDEFTRVTERPLLQDSVAVPPADGSVIVLARIRLNARGAIESNASIDTSVRTLAGAAIAAGAVATAQLDDNAVTLTKLDTSVRPLGVQGADAIRIDTDATARLITIGETHAARADNPHATTAAQIDNQAGANQLVARINGGAGVIARARIQSSLVSGVVAFEQVPASGSEIISDPIDPGFGPGPMAVELALEDVPAAGATTAADFGFGRTTMLRSEVDDVTGRFRVFATRAATAPAGPVKVRWFATRPLPRA